MSLNNLRWLRNTTLIGLVAFRLLTTEKRYFHVVTVVKGNRSMPPIRYNRYKNVEVKMKKTLKTQKPNKIECEPMPNVMAAQPNIVGVL